jgi:hypothetical protein
MADTSQIMRHFSDETWLRQILEFLALASPKGIALLYHLQKFYFAHCSI